MQKETVNDSEVNILKGIFGKVSFTWCKQVHGITNIM